MDDNRILSFIKEITNRITTFFKTKNVVTFLLFLLLASGLWLMHSTSSQREMRSKAIIKYTGIPPHVVLNEELPHKIEYMIKDDNKQLWNYISYSFDTLCINLSEQFNNSDNLLEIEYESHLHKIITQFSPTSKITELTPNIFSTSYITLQTKTVPIKMLGDIRLHPQYVLTDSISIHPKEITIIGKPSELDSISYIAINAPTSIINKSQTIECEPILTDNTKSPTKNILVDIKVEMSTEKQITIPITSINTPENINIKTFPSEVNATFNIGLSKYNSIKDSDIILAIDYNLIKSNSTATQNLIITQKPQYIYNLRFNPKSVEYIIENKQSNDN